MKRSTSCIAALLICCLSASAVQTAQVVDVHHIDYSPKLTGTLVNPGWQDASKFTRFRLAAAQPGHIPSERTSVYLMADDANVYIGLRLFDVKRPAGSPLVGGEKEDWVSFSIGPVSVQGPVDYFQVNPDGAQSNGTIGPDGRMVPGQPLKWTSLVHRAAREWTAEITIPFASLGIDPKVQPTVEFKVRRFINRTKEQIEGPVPPPTLTNRQPGAQKIRFLWSK